MCTREECRRSQGAGSFILLAFVYWHAGAQESQSVWGSVEDRTGAPLPNAIALLTSRENSGERHIGRTDAMGRYHFSVSRPGAYRLELQAPGFVPTIIDPIAVATGTEETLASAVLRIDSLACTGRVYPSDIRLLPVDRPVGALSGTLSLQQAPKSRRRAHPPAQVVLFNARGEVRTTVEQKDGARFRFGDQPPGKYKIQISGPGLRAELWDVVIREALETEFVLPLSRCLAGDCTKEPQRSLDVAWCY